MKILLGPGASGGVERLGRYVMGLRRRGFDADAIPLPRGSAERALPAFLKAAQPAAEIVAGGHSFGARVSTMAAAQGEPYPALLLFSYPLHPPGKQDLWRERTSHWRGIEQPVLFISGDRDQFADLELLHRARKQMRQAQLYLVRGAGHGFKEAHLDEALNAAASWLATLPASKS